MTFTDLCLRLARDVRDLPELDRVPLPVISSCIEAGLRQFANRCPATLGELSDIEAMELEPCMLCENLIDPVAPGGAVKDAEGDWSCAACTAEAKGRQSIF